MRACLQSLVLAATVAFANGQALFTDAAPQAVAAKQVKMAMRVAVNQQQVWNEVSMAQDRLSTVAGSVRAAASPTSYMLSLESPKVQ